MNDLQKLTQYRSSLENVILQKQEEVTDLKQSLKTVNEDIFLLYEGKQKELPL